MPPVNNITETISRQELLEKTKKTYDALTERGLLEKYRLVGNTADEKYRNVGEYNIFPVKMPEILQENVPVCNHGVSAFLSTRRNYNGWLYDAQLDQLMYIFEGAFHSQKHTPTIINFKHHDLYYYKNGIVHNEFGPAVIQYRVRILHAYLGEYYSSSHVSLATKMDWMKTLWATRLRKPINSPILQWSSGDCERNLEEFCRIAEKNKQSNSDSTENIELKQENEMNAEKTNGLASRVTTILIEDNKKAAWRTAANGTTELIQEMLVKVLTQDIKNKRARQSMRDQIVHSLQTKDGDSGISMVIGVTLPYVAEMLPENLQPVALKMAEEFRVRALAHFQTRIAKVALSETAQKFGEILAPLLEEQEETTPDTRTGVRAAATGAAPVENEHETTGSPQHAKSSKKNS